MSSDKDARITALAERSSYVENILSHAFVAEVASVLWQRKPPAFLQIFNSEVDDSGFDLIFRLGATVRYIQLKQAHERKVPT